MRRRGAQAARRRAQSVSTVALSSRNPDTLLDWIFVAAAFALAVLVLALFVLPAIAASRAEGKAGRDDGDEGEREETR